MVHVTEASSVKVLPDACVDVTFDLTAIEAPRAYVAPALDRPETYPHAAGTWLFGARLFPHAASLLIKGGLSQLRPGWNPLENFVGARAQTLALQIATAADDAHRTLLLDAFFVEALLTRSVDARVTAALAAIFSSSGAITILEVARAGAVSERTLGRLFDRWVGIAPKRFARIVRFQHALRRLGGSLDGAQLATELGYFDQAHLIRDMRELFGAVPTEALSLAGSTT